MAERAYMFETPDEAGTRDAGRIMAGLLAPGDVVSLNGDLGAGKTVLVKGIAEGLGTASVVTSPTFNILLVHEGRLTLNHFDLYRLERPEELEDIDFWGVLESGGVAVVEWGERFPDALPPEHLAVYITIADTARRFRLEPHGLRAGETAAAWVDAVGSVDS